jgi:hypothetical protein
LASYLGLVKSPISATSPTAGERVDSAQQRSRATSGADGPARLARPSARRRGRGARAARHAGSSISLSRSTTMR